MKVLLIEDELPARAKLKAMLTAYDSSVTVVAELGSVRDSIEWIQKNNKPDLAFVDIQLSDDHSFEIFRRISVQFPVIFTTAYDKYLLESFEFNSIDYLLKPITEEKLKRAMEKWKTLGLHFLETNLHKVINHSNNKEQRIIARKGAEFVALDLSDIAYFFTEHKIVFLRDFQNRQMIVDKNLADLESMDTTRFFRLNRKYLANKKAIERFKSDQGKIQVFLNPNTKEEVHVSKETAPEFREWIVKS